MKRYRMLIKSHKPYASFRGDLIKAANVEIARLRCCHLCQGNEMAINHWKRKTRQHCYSLGYTLCNKLHFTFSTYFFYCEGAICSWHGYSCSCHRVNVLRNDERKKNVRSTTQYYEIWHANKAFHLFPPNFVSFVAITRAPYIGSMQASHQPTAFDLIQ